MQQLLSATVRKNNESSILHESLLVPGEANWMGHLSALFTLDGTLQFESEAYHDWIGRYVEAHLMGH